MKGRETFRRLLLARGNVESELGEAGAHRWVGEHLHHRTVERGDDLLGRALGGKETEPSRSVEPGDATLIGSRNVRDRLRATWGKIGDRFHGSRAYLRQHRGGLRNEDVH